MSALSGIPVSAENAAPCEARTGNTRPILHEIRHALALLQEKSESSCIDLQAMPLSSIEFQDLENILGTGEVRITINTLGQSTISETKFPGVWLTTHLDEDGLVQSRLIEVAHIPEIVPANPQEICESGPALTQMLENLSDE